MKGSNNQSETI